MTAGYSQRLIQVCFPSTYRKSLISMTERCDRQSEKLITQAQEPTNYLEIIANTTSVGYWVSTVSIDDTQ